jgi:ribosomal protein L21E
LAEIAGDDDTKLKIKVAIDKKELEDGAKVAFEEFQKSPEWIVATGDLAGMTDKAIGMLIEDIEKYKTTAKNLSPKQIKQLNRALVELYKKQREGNPFKALSTAIMEAKNRVSVYEDELSDAQNKLDELTKKQAKSFSAERAKDIDSLIAKIKKLKEQIKEGMKLKATDIVEGLEGMVSTANAVSNAVGDMWETFGGSKEVSQQLNGVFSVLDKTLETAKLGAQIGGKWGAIIGAVGGLFSGIFGAFFGGKDEITEAVERSERSVKLLEIAYKRLEVAIEEAYGAAKWGAEQAAIANKKLQLAELKRQLALERSRDSKDRDEGKINDLMGQIEDLKIEIEKSIKDITNDLLGISSVGNAAEELVSSMIDAFRQGEDYMLKYDESFEKMIDNMVMKAIVGRVIGDRLQSLWDRVDAVAKEKGEPYQKQIEELMAAKKANEDSLEVLGNGSFSSILADENFLKKYGITLTDKLKQENENIDEQIEKLQKQYSDAIAPTPEDVQSVRDDAANWKDSVKSEFDAYMELFGIKFGDRAGDKQLSSLQQGISQITEVTAQSLEAYANSISQQAYLRNDLLTQIRDAVIGMDMDVQVATQAQILLQLQQSYQVQMSIESILQGVLVPSGRAFAVELLS